MKTRRRNISLALRIKTWNINYRIPSPVYISKRINTKHICQYQTHNKVSVNMFSKRTVYAKDETGLSVRFHELKKPEDWCAQRRNVFLYQGIESLQVCKLRFPHELWVDIIFNSTAEFKIFPFSFVEDVSWSEVAILERHKRHFSVTELYPANSRNILPIKRKS